ncbi:MAG TPA: glucose 1-dehydrogenase [Flavitalea sp.]|nr:glucose 1-dehydrogenase [Flavitalea sp.]
MRFDNKICLVTGGGSGIGQATAIQLAREGGSVVVIDLNESAAKETVDRITQGGGQALAAVCDVGNIDQVRNAIDLALKTWSRIDVLVNNAAMMTFKPIVELSIVEWDKLMDVNLRSVFLFCKYCIPHMKHGAIVNISSVHAHATTAQVVPYASSKGAMEAFTRGLAQEHPSSDFRVNCIAPGAVNTPMLRSNPNIKSGKEKLEGEVAEPPEIAEAICFLASDQASYINGTTLVVDGGRLDIL